MNKEEFLLKARNFYKVWQRVYLFKLFIIMQLKENYPLSKLTTMGVGGPAKFLAKVRTRADLLELSRLAEQKRLPFLVLGGGSNVIISDRGFEGLVAAMALKGVEVLKQDKCHIWLKVGAGVELEELIKLCVRKKWWGLENLSLIPGTVGGLVIQNGGAYGQEIGELVEKVEVYDFKQWALKNFSAAACGFIYRSSSFKDEAPGRYVVLSVVLRLSKQPAPNLSYKDVKEYFERRNLKSPQLKQIRRAIIKIRRNKLPDWRKTGSAGSFFKNILLEKKNYRALQHNIRVNFSRRESERLDFFKQHWQENGKIKIPSAWLLDICGLKGQSSGGAKIYEQQPLVIINGGQATARDIMRLVRIIRRKVFRLTGMVLEPEPRLIGFTERELVKYFALD